MRWVGQSLIVMVVWATHLRDGRRQLGTHVLRVLLLLLLLLSLLLLHLLLLLLLLLSLLLMGVESAHAGQRDGTVAPGWACAVWFGDELLGRSRVGVLGG